MPPINCKYIPTGPASERTTHKFPISAKYFRVAVCRCCTVLQAVLVATHIHAEATRIHYSASVVCYWHTAIVSPTASHIHSSAASESES